jgi:DNA-binding transcriptional ArsR family regulator
MVVAAPFDEFPTLDRIVHEPARLAILTALSACERADFLFLCRLTGLTKGNCTAHLAKLEQAELILIEKSFRGKVPHTEIQLTKAGRDSIARYWRDLDRMRRAAARWPKLAKAASG